MHGLHLTADLHHCRWASRWLTAAAFLADHCVQAAAAGRQAVARVFHAFPVLGQGPAGGTATVLMTALTSLFDAGGVERRSLMRGAIAA